MSTMLALDDRRRVLGPFVHPTGELRMLRTKTVGRLQMEWEGQFGKGWFDVPVVDVDVLPAKAEDVLPAKAES
jgi:hypothetical protein